MSAQPIRSRSVAPPSWRTGSSTYNSSYLLAGMRAAVFVLALLAVLAIVVLL